MTSTELFLLYIDYKARCQRVGIPPHAMDTFAEYRAWSEEIQSCQN